MINDETAGQNGPDVFSLVDSYDMRIAPGKPFVGCQLGQGFGNELSLEDALVIKGQVSDDVIVRAPNVNAWGVPIALRENDLFFHLTQNSADIESGFDEYTATALTNNLSLDDVEIILVFGVRDLHGVSPAPEPLLDLVDWHDFDVILIDIRTRRIVGFYL